ncbi:MAG: hypothetical protein AAGE93_24250 [Bacteroidota bacterium]
MNVFKVDSASHFRHLWSLMVLSVILPIVGYYLMLYKLGEFNVEAALIVSFVVFTTLILPLLILHINYYLYSKNDKFLYDESREIMVYERKGMVTEFEAKNIESVVSYKSWPLAENRTPIFPWDVYHYTAIELKNGSLLKVSSLVVYEFDKKVKIDGIRIRKTFYPWIG